MEVHSLVSLLTSWVISMDILTLSELQFHFLQMGMRICFYRIIIKINFTYMYLTIKITSQSLISFSSCFKIMSS